MAATLDFSALDMFRRPVTFALAALVIALATTEKAHAAFVMPEFDFPTELIAECLEECSSQPADEQAAPANREPLMPVDLVLNLSPIAPSTGGASTGGASPFSVSGPGFGVPLTASASVTGGEIVARLTHEVDCRLPVAFLSGVFRPPRG